ncbi:TPA: hypothetical protein DDW69_04850 [candidate division CPR2 bacterium]|uniref:Uncharacterized protein n=1 Tax=candidate division CPR2 bacterium GW2011_GWC1_41_48 TaxID=1618344 RepID=A0A0G0Z8J6_UNCC2|nr:MAG: hypothetical protein UT47_C0002G0153 [candidate division CPR2 bacterium GW2011_GWC2_39_35]KKR27255.1 MAG: hypothetical protein UT59_C0064G0007 [candidate division CPR2 bacterium GW2011_GWD1_39_7]KKR27889.1 MAG: hypothetical protein UT60_C0033G0012 [candidate division CPR2 bacterium GW2011_GWD2_39_7]KKS09373.1 MAG: hypothetical protein UU65_C0002G0151 [candidate division CPR2 bacterium GW2011_GWC1_41_48]OGB57724.1 MAG: hypothetical protein A2Y27_02070 [candidate division CPR2 bacterium G
MSRSVKAMIVMAGIAAAAAFIGWELQSFQEVLSGHGTTAGYVTVSVTLFCICCGLEEMIAK